METPLNTVRFFEPFDFTRVAETWRQVRKCLSLSAFRSGGRVAHALHLSMVMLNTNERYQQ